MTTATATTLQESIEAALVSTGWTLEQARSASTSLNVVVKDSAGKAWYSIEYTWRPAVRIEDRREWKRKCVRVLSLSGMKISQNGEEFTISKGYVRGADDVAVMAADEIVRLPSAMYPEEARLSESCEVVEGSPVVVYGGQ